MRAPRATDPPCASAPFVDYHPGLVSTSRLASFLLALRLACEKACLGCGGGSSLRAAMRTTIDASQLRVTGCLGSGVNGIAFSAVSPALPTNAALKVYPGALYGPIDQEGSEVHALQRLSTGGRQRNIVQFFGTTCLPIAPLLRQPSVCSNMINRTGFLRELAQGDDGAPPVCAAAVVTGLLEGPQLASALLNSQKGSLLGKGHKLTRSSLDALDFGSASEQAQRFHSALARVHQAGQKELEAFVRPGSTSGWDVLLGLATGLQCDLNLKPHMLQVTCAYATCHHAHARGRA